ncbi:MAG: tripartite tricarboxylate transporter TctB family protein [Spirochaetales bacterium]|nr:tripartite tricarboxylate transporter TctB family protein [Spirochaetales bacterium]
MMRLRRAEWLATLVCTAVVVVVFQQIRTDMMEAGIARGGPFENAASYPRTIALILGALVLIQILLRFFPSTRQDTGSGERAEETPNLVRPALLVSSFAVYIGLLGSLGYHIATAPFLAIVMWICGERGRVRILVVSVLVAFSLAFVFEVLLKIVLPGGILRLNIPW